MPIVTAGAFSRPEQVADYWIDKLEADKSTLGIQYIAGYDQKLIPANNYPTVCVNLGRSEKTIHATRTWLFTWRIQFYVYHALASATHLQRSREQAQFCTNLVDYLEIDKTLGEKVIFGWVTDEVPGVMQPYATKGEFVVSTRLDWFATSEGRF